MKDTILKALSNINCFYSIIWMKATGKDKYTFREESKVHEMLLAAMSVYALAAYTPELIRNEDWFSFDEFLDDLRNDRAEVVKHLKWRAGGHHFLNEVTTDKYITACKKILGILKEV